jgi:bifunctional ADP-heptose synthase (sugar kinase/adenylyltransferase)
LKPGVLVKGGDWQPDAIIGAREVRAWGGKVHSIAFAHQRSTTALLAKVRTGPS